MKKAKAKSRVKLNHQKAVEIRKLYATKKFRQPELAKRFGTSQSTVSKIVNREAWR